MTLQLFGPKIFPTYKDFLFKKHHFIVTKINIFPISVVSQSHLFHKLTHSLRISFSYSILTDGLASAYL